MEHQEIYFIFPSILVNRLNFRVNFHKNKTILTIFQIIFKKYFNLGQSIIFRKPTSANVRKTSQFFCIKYRLEVDLIFYGVETMRLILALFKNPNLWVVLLLYSGFTNAADQTGITGIDTMITSGQNIIKVAAKWGGILTVVGSALALGSGRLEGALAQTVCKILIVVGLLVAAFTYFSTQLGVGFAF